MSKADDVEIRFTPPHDPYRYESRTPIEHSLWEWKLKLREYHHRCAYCGIAARATPEGYLTRDHIIPVIAGGSDDITNIVPACWTCNELKGRLPAGVTVPYPKPRRRRIRRCDMTWLQRVVYDSKT